MSRAVFAESEALNMSGMPGVFCRAAVWAAGALLLFSAAAARAEDAADPDPDIEFALRIERAYKKLALRVSPCVVSVHTNVRAGGSQEEWRRLHEHSGGMLPKDSDGSGVIIDPSGLILTNEHVVRDAEQIRVSTDDGKSYIGRVCGSDPRGDLALVKLTGDNLPAKFPCVVFADSDKVEIGQFALAIGNPFGLSRTFTTGVVSARHRNLHLNSTSGDVFYGNMIQTDAAINPGNSGGPLFDLRGRLIGINTMIYSKTGASMGFGFAIPVNHVQKRLPYLRDGHEVQYGWLGIRLDDIKPGQKIFKAPDDKGVLISEVIPNTPADRAGLEQGMVILNYETTRLESATDLVAAVNETPVGSVVTLKVIDREGKLRDIKARISKRYAELAAAAVKDPDAESGDEEDEESPLADIEPGDDKKPGETARKAVDGPFKNTLLWRGMQVRELSAEAGAKRGGRVEVVRVTKGSPADRAGFYEGAILTEIKIPGGDAIQKIGALEDFKRLTQNLGGPAALYARLDGYITIDAR
jgi:S1-C subfamily serine protease